MSRIFQAFLDNETAIRRVFSRYFRSSEDIEDLTQEVFIKCFAAEMKSRIINPKAFLLRSAKNLALGEKKKKFRTTTESIEVSGGSDVYVDENEISAEAQVDSRKKLLALTRAIASLPPPQQRAFWLRRVEGLKLAQIAARLNISVSTAKKHVAEALLMCEEHLQKIGYEPGEFGAERYMQGCSPSKRGVVVALSVSSTGNSEGGNDD